MKHPNNFKHLFPKKNFGQHFLISATAIDSIIDHAMLDEKDVVVEIGPGLGALTEKLLSKAGRTVVIEKDKRMVAHLKNEFKKEIATNKLTIIEEDAVIFDFKKYFMPERFKVVSNLPYNVSIPILFNLYMYKEYIFQMTLMFQKEVADRIIASPGCKKFGLLSINAQINSEIDRVIDLTPQDFYPPPKVSSTVLNFKILDNPKFKIFDNDIFQVLLKAAFYRRRRKIINSLESSGAFEEIDFKKMFTALNIDPDKRAEALSLEDFVLAENYISNVLKD